MPSTTDYKEKAFENAIVEGFRQQGWKTAPTDDGYNRLTALYEQDLIDWMDAAYPEDFAKFKKTSAQWRETFLARIAQYLTENGTLRALQDDIGMAGMPYFKLSESEPENRANEKVVHRYQSNILRVVQQVHFRVETQESIDLVFFINGIPVATAEVKTNFTQDVNEAVEEYRQNRHPKLHKTGMASALLQHGRGAIVHFAISESDIQMTTMLDGETTRFLPFNAGYNKHAGNAPATLDHPYPVSYFWEKVGQPKNWLRIFHSFVFTEEKKVKTKYGSYKTQKTLIFPRYHQWRSVTKMIGDVAQRGVGFNYLIEHSPGSGKTKTITWTAFRLTEMRHEDGSPFFDTILIITDRTVLNDQLVAAVKGFNRTPGLVKGIDRLDGTSKTAALQKALEDGIRIVVVTIQTFPFAMEQIILNTKLAKRHFAVIIDEAHNSQSSRSSGKLNAALGYAGKPVMDTDMESFVERMQKSRKRPENVSFFGFTATPRHQTFMLFGRMPDGSAVNLANPPKGIVPGSFDVYPMRQAIEEGFILDVMKGYTPYKVAWQLENPDPEFDPLVDSKEARRKLARWKNLHPTNVTQKTEFIIRHFSRNVAGLLNGQAKAMIVTSSRAAVVRYKLAFDHYLAEHPELNSIAVLKIGIPMAAFSGEVKGFEAVHPADSKEGFTYIDTEAIYDEKTLNPTVREALDRAFDRDDYRLMLVANKFQTGFDQPKLCAMYVDKPLGSEIEIVQTFSRLNRIYRGKETTFIVDFANAAEDVAKAFKQYDEGAEISDVQDSNVIFSMVDAVKKANVFSKDDVEAFSSRYYYASLQSVNEGKGELKDMHAILTAIFDPIARVYNEKLRDCCKECSQLTSLLESAERSGNESCIAETRSALEDATRERNVLESFRKSLNKTVSTYNYLAQLVDYNNSELEVFIAFCALLSKYLKRMPREEIDLSGILLTGYTIKPETPEVPPPNPQDDKVGPLKPLSPYVNEPRSEMPEHLKEILKKISNFAGDIVSEDDAIQYCSSITDKLRANDKVMVQIKNNSEEGARQGLVDPAVHSAVVDLFDQYTHLTEAVLGSKEKKNELVDIVLAMLQQKLSSADFHTRPRA